MLCRAERCTPVKAKSAASFTPIPYLDLLRIPVFSSTVFSSLAGLIFPTPTRCEGENKRFRNKRPPGKVMIEK